MLPSHNDLTYFQELAARRNISRAAERLGISQPSLSLALRRLEDAIGAPLFLRKKSGLELTEAGEALRGGSQELLRQWSGLKATALNRSQEMVGRFTIGCHVAVAQYTLPQFLPKLLAAFPQVEIALEHDLSRKIVEGVISRRIHLGLVVNPVRHPDLVIRKLLKDRVTFWSRDGSFSDTLLYDPNLGQSQAVLKRLAKSPTAFRRLIPSASLEIIAMLAREGAGTAILPTRVAEATGGLTECAKAPYFEDSICLIHRADGAEAPALRKIRELIREGVR